MINVLLDSVSPEKKTDIAMAGYRIQKQVIYWKTEHNKQKPRKLRIKD